MNANPYMYNKSLISKGATWNIEWKTGKIRIPFNSINPITKAAIENILENNPNPIIELPPLQLNPWNNLAKHRTLKAIVLPFRVFPP